MLVEYTVRGTVHCWLDPSPLPRASVLLSLIRYHLGKNYFIALDCYHYIDKSKFRWLSDSMWSVIIIYHLGMSMSMSVCCARLLL